MNLAFLQKSIQGIPVWGWALAGIAGVGVAWYFLNKKGPPATNAAQVSATPNAPGTTGYSVDANGNVVDANGNIVAASQSPYPAVPQGQIPIIPPGTCPIYDPSGNVVAYGPCPPTPIVPTPPGPTTKTATVRAKVSGSTYDKTHYGVPLDDKPGGKTISFAPFGSALSIDPTGIMGPPAAFQGLTSNIWYKTSTGSYVNSLNIVSIS